MLHIVNDTTQAVVRSFSRGGRFEWPNGDIAFGGTVGVSVGGHTIHEGVEVVTGSGPVRTKGAPVMVNGVVQEPVTYSWPAPESVYAQKVTASKTEASNRILTAYPIWKQNNMLAKGVYLLDTFRANGAWTAEQQALEALLTSAWAWVDSVRAASNTHEADLAAILADNGLSADAKAEALTNAVPSWPVDAPPAVNV